MIFLFLALYLASHECLSKMIWLSISWNEKVYIVIYVHITSESRCFNHSLVIKPLEELSINTRILHFMSFELKTL